ncbi:MAG TPA: phosphonate monoester hydrolase, partial [Alphaproteobacteria bacterium]|nr:phosphonate monoester hydrolase [Alphaproteobacteria bacterium]
GGEVPAHQIEGRSLLPFLHGNTPEGWRDYVISEYDYSVLPMRFTLGLDSRQARLFMVFDGRHKMVHSAGGHLPMLFDLKSDPQEFTDLGGDPEHTATRDRLYAMLHDWSLRLSQRVTMSEAAIDKKVGEPQREGVLVGVHREDDLGTEFTSRYTGDARQIHFENEADRKRYGGE